MSANLNIEHLMFLKRNSTTIKENKNGDLVFKALSDNYHLVDKKVVEWKLMVPVGDNLVEDRYLLYVRYQFPTNRQFFTKARMSGTVFLASCCLKYDGSYGSGDIRTQIVKLVGDTFDWHH